MDLLSINSLWPCDALWWHGPQSALVCVMACCLIAKPLPGQCWLIICGAIHFQHDEVINWKHFPCYWPFVRGIHQSPVDSPHKGQWRGALMFSLILAWTNGWANSWEADDLRYHHTHYDITIMKAIALEMHESNYFITFEFTHSKPEPYPAGD